MRWQRCQQIDTALALVSVRVQRTFFAAVVGGNAESIRNPTKNKAIDYFESMLELGLCLQEIKPPDANVE